MIKPRAVTSNNPKPLAHYTEATIAGGLAFLAGQLPSDFKNGVPAEARIRTFRTTAPTLNFRPASP
jgi:enamine deaminase RidA (YjgF/YER057c/UK114 family)